MVVVALLGILTSMAVPSFRNMLVQTRLANQSNELMSIVQFARSEAIKRNQTVRFCAAESATASSCAAGNWPHWIVLDSNDNLLRRGSVHPTLQLTSNLASDTLSLFPSGLNNVGPDRDSLVLCSHAGDGETQRTLRIGLSSRVTISKAEGCS